MSVILQFPVIPREGKAQKDSAELAEVIIFPGVRIERRTIETPKKIARVRKHRQSQSLKEEDLA